MPVTSKAQFRYAQMVSKNGEKASEAKREWASEVLAKSGDVDFADLPEHSEKPRYAGIGRKYKKRGVKSYGK